MDEKKKVYVETSVISDLTARPSHYVFDLARQMVESHGGALWIIGEGRFIK